MEAEARIKFTDGDSTSTVIAQLSPLQAAEIVAARYGFFDVDLKDNDKERYTIVATAHKRSCTSKGRTLEEAVERLLEMFINE